MTSKIEEYDLLIDDIYFYYNLFDVVQNSFIDEHVYLVNIREKCYQQFAKRYLKQQTMG